jgi:hypothetical protein
MNTPICFHKSRCIKNLGRCNNGQESQHNHFWLGLGGGTLELAADRCNSSPGKLKLTLQS